MLKMVSVLKDDIKEDSFKINAFSMVSGKEHIGLHMCP